MRIAMRTGMVLPILLTLLTATPALRAQEPPATAGQQVGSTAKGDLDRINRLLTDGEGAAAESLAVPLLSRLEQAGEGESAHAARCRYLIGWARFKLGDAAAADGWLRRAIETYDALEAPQDSALMPVLQIRGDVLIELYRPDEALDTYERRRQIALALGGEDAVELPGSHYNLGRARYYGGDFGGALREYTLALELASRRWGSESLYAAYCQNVIGMVEDEIGEFVEAKRRYQEVVRIVQAQKEPNRLFLANTLNNLGWTLRNLGDYEEARLNYEEALGIRKELIGPPDANIASTLGNLADLHREMSDMTTAERYATEALEMRKQVYGPEHPVVATSLEFLASLHLETGDAARARDEFRSCLEIRRKAFAEDHPDVALAQSELAGALRATGDLDGARKSLRAALPALESGFTGLHPNVSRAYLESARVEAQAGAYPAAFAFALEAERRSREHLHLACRVLPERLALRYATERVSGRDLLLSLCERVESDDMVRPTWDAVIRSRALVLDAMAARHQAVRALEDPRNEALARDLRSTRERLAHLMVAGPDAEHPGEYQQKLRKAQAEAGEAEEALASSSVTAAENLRRGGLGLEAILAQLGAHDALLAFVSYKPEGEEARYAAFLADPDSLILIPLGPAAALEEAVRGWEAAIRAGASGAGGTQSGEAAYRDVALGLRKIVWDPLAGHLQTCRTLYLVPDGALHRVSFAALPAGNGKYLAEEDLVFHYLSAERDLVPGPRSAGASTGLLLVGNPDFDRDSETSSGASDVSAPGPASVDCGGLRGIRFEPLEATRGEIEDVQAIWREREPRTVTLLTGPEATEAAVKSQLPMARVIHLATHGFVLDGTCEERAGNSRGIQGLSRKRVPGSMSRANPLQLSGLALAGANHRENAPPEDDGILTAEEISSLDLGAADLVILSACETGLGRIEATEGVVGLRRSLQIAGAGTLVMSLWAVEDKSTREWMADLYRECLVDGLPIPGAVQHAERACIAARRNSGRGAHPFYWAGFVSSGTPR